MTSPDDLHGSHVSGLNTANGRPMMEGDIIWDSMNDIERSYPAEIMFLSGPKRMKKRFGPVALLQTELFLLLCS